MDVYLLEPSANTGNVRVPAGRQNTENEQPLPTQLIVVESTEATPLAPSPPELEQPEKEEPQTRGWFATARDWWYA